MAEVVSRARVLPHDGDAGDLGCLLKGAEVSDIGEASLLHERDRLTCAVAGAAVDEVLGFGVEARNSRSHFTPVEVEHLGTLEVATRVFLSGAHVENDRVCAHLDGAGGAGP